MSLPRVPEWLHLELDKLGVRFPPPPPVTPTSTPLPTPITFRDYEGDF